MTVNFYSIGLDKEMLLDAFDGFADCIYLKVCINMWSSTLRLSETILNSIQVLLWKVSVSMLLTLAIKVVRDAKCDKLYEYLYPTSVYG